MSNTPNLVFFNKEGYPYNFTLNDGIWNGKIFFKPNSTDIFENITLYTLEKVDPIEYTDYFNIVNSEIYNTSGMTLSKGGYTNLPVTNILSVNQDPNFYTKWIYGFNFNKYFPIGTIISFSGNCSTIQSNGESDFIDGYYFTVLRTDKDAIMISTTTKNSDFTFIFDNDIFDIFVTSHYCISIPDKNQSLISSFNADIDDRISVIGTNDGNNDSVYQIIDKEYTKTNIFDYNLSGATSVNDVIDIELDLYTERPLLYKGNIDISYDGGILYATFLGGKNSNIKVGSNFICENDNWNHLLGGNEYEIQSFITEEFICTTGVSFFEETYEEDDGNIEKLYYVQLPELYGIKENWDIKFTSTSNKSNNDLVKYVTNIVSGTTTSNNETTVYYNIYLDSFVKEMDNVQYTLNRVLKPHEQNKVVVNSSIDNSTYNGYANVLSTTNKLYFKQEISNDGLYDSLDTFILKYTNIFKFNGIDIYRKNNDLIFDGRYGGQNSYFNVNCRLNNIPQNIEEKYSDSLGNVPIFNLILDECDITYERRNMSEDLNVSYFADITLDLFDDAQDYGFNLTFNGVQYYIPFNDNSGTTSYTLETIKSFIDKYKDAFYYNGIDIYSGTTISGDTINHLYLSAHEPNIEVLETNVKVNRNSSYTITETNNNYMMIVSNKLISSFSLDNLGLSTGMVIKINGSSYAFNNKEFNIIGLDSNSIELSYQGPMYSENNILLSLKTREYLRSPRESNDRDIYYRYRWEDDIDSTIFLYDLTGENLVPYGNNSDYEYIGPKPLTSNGDMVILNRDPNKDKKYIAIPYKQQTIFEQLDFKLERFNDDNISILPKPIQVFIGYNSNLEGVNQKNLIIERIDNVKYEGYADGQEIYFDISNNEINLNGYNTDSFLEMGFKSNRYLRIKLDDKKPYTQDIFESYQDFLIKNVMDKKIILYDNLSEYSTKDKNYYFILELLPEQIAYFKLYGETESEDERFESNLNLLGISLTEEDEYIFKSSDVKEDGIDYRLLNRKRKEMFNVFPDIYNYIGSYRAILNSIDFFGYDDIELVEYYKNIQEDSPYYNKLKRVIIPDLNDREVEGWTYSEIIPNPVKYVKTNLFNLTYRITDEEGNNVLLYTLKDVQVKLNGLKKWLRKNVVPIDSNVRDITGVSECVGTEWRRFDSTNNITKNQTLQNVESVNINYTATQSFNDSWLVSARFYTVSGVCPKSWDLKVMTFKKDPNTGKLYPEQRWDVLKKDLSNFNFVINWDYDYTYDRYFYVETKTYNDYGFTKQINKMYRLEDGQTYYFDEFKNYTLVNNNFKYKTYPYIQNQDYVYIIDDMGNFWIIDKEIQSNRIS